MSPGSRPRPSLPNHGHSRPTATSTSPMVISHALIFRRCAWLAVNNPLPHPHNPRLRPPRHFLLRHFPLRLREAGPCSATVSGKHAMSDRHPFTPPLVLEKAAAVVKRAVNWP